MRLRRLVLVLVLLTAGKAAERIKPDSGSGEEASLDKNRGASLVEWHHPEYPAELKAGGEKAWVKVRFVIDEKGAITDPEALGGDERFYAAALAAITRWKYEPETRRGQPVPVSRDVRFTFDPAGPPPGRSKFMAPYPVEESPLRPPSELHAPDPAYPEFLESRRLSGEVELAMSVDKTGRVDGVEIGRVTHPDFLTAALDAVAGWGFRPAAHGRLPVRGVKVAVLQFSVTTLGSGAETGVDWPERNGIFLREPAGTKTADYFDVTPEAVVMVDPVYPHELLRSGTTGGARVNFTVSLRGEVIDVAVEEATAPEFGASLAAAIAAWRFKPLRRQGEVTGAQFSITWKFTAPRAGGTEERLLAELARGEKPAGARQLDRPLQPLFLRPPVHPAAYLGGAGGAGEADIEATIDRDGRLRLLRVVAATGPEFGWAAATAASQWLFETPLKDGKPVDVRVVIPVEFKAR